jgi:hypothetical protein
VTSGATFDRPSLQGRHPVFVVAASIVVDIGMETGQRAKV